MDLAFRKYVLLFLLVGHLLLSALTLIPGFLLIDEAILHLTVRNFSESGGFEIWNGYREFPSSELRPPFTSIHNGRLVSQYPYLYPLLAAPFYLLGGIRGQFWLNVLVYPGIVLLCYRIANLLFREKGLALNSCYIFIFATYSWQYSQELWPHALLTGVLMAAFYYGIRAFYAEHSRQAWQKAMIAGLICGLAAGIRLEGVFLLPCLLVLFLFARPWRPKDTLAVLLGTIPGILALSATNAIKFQTWIPFSYGGSLFKSRVGLREIAWLFPLVIWGFAGVFTLWLLTRPTVSEVVFGYIRRHPYLCLTGAVLFGLGLLWAFPDSRRFFQRHLRHIRQLLLDFRTAHRSSKPTLSYSPGGTLIYANGLKKAFLQSCPYLAILLLPALDLMRRKKEVSQPLFILFTFLLIFPAFFLYAGWSGDMCLNLRYFLPLLPVTSILCAYAWRELTRSLPPQHQWKLFGLLGGIAILILTYYLRVVRRTFMNFADQEILYLNWPLVLAAAIAILFGFREFSIRMKRRAAWIWQYSSPFCSSLLLLMTFTAMAWSGVVAFFYDYPLFRQHRAAMCRITTTATELVKDDAIIFADISVPLHGVGATRERIRIASPVHDQFKDFRELLKFYSQQGRPVYGSFQTWARWQSFKKDGFFDGFELKVLHEFSPFNIILCQIVPKSGDDD